MRSPHFVTRFYSRLLYPENTGVKWIVPLLVVVSSAAGCRVVIESTGAGHVESESGAYNCTAGQSCEFDVSDIHFDEVFIGIPTDPNESFLYWESDSGEVESSHLCGGHTRPCRLSTTGFDSAPELMAILESDQSFPLRPVFGQPDNQGGDWLSACLQPIREHDTAGFVNPGGEWFGWQNNCAFRVTVRWSDGEDCCLSMNMDAYGSTVGTWLVSEFRGSLSWAVCPGAQPPRIASGALWREHAEYRCASRPAVSHLSLGTDSLED